MLLAFLSAAGCDSKTPAALDQPQDEAYKQLLAMGFPKDAIQDRGEYYLIGEDIVYWKRARNAFVPQGVGVTAKQYTTNNLVGVSAVNPVYVDVRGLAGHPAWQNAARAAISKWQNFSQSHILLLEGPSQFGVVNIRFVLTGCDDATKWGNSDFPSNGYPGSEIRLNPCAGTNPPTDSQRLLAAAHELGHTLGFRHTNWQQVDGGGCNPTGNPGSEGANHVAGTPTSGNDPNSVMNGCTAGTSWAGFSQNDSLAFRTRYPVPPVLSVSYPNDQPTISWTSVFGAAEYYVYAMRRFTHISQFGQDQVSVSEDLLGTTTGLSLVDPYDSYTGCTDYWSSPEDHIEAWFEVRAAIATAWAIGAQQAYIVQC